MIGVLEMPAAFVRLARANPAWTEWFAGLPRMVEDLLESWSLTVDGELRSGQAAVVVPVRTEDTSSAVLKVGWPHPEAALEHLALRAWNGRGAVRLLRADPHRFALLLERAESDVDLHSEPVLVACQVVARLYRELHRPAPPQFDRLSELTTRWAEGLAALAGHPSVPRRLVVQAAGTARDLASAPGTDGLLLHTDLHYSNVLKQANVLRAEPRAAERRTWLAIDPKPLSGDPCFEVAPLLWNRWDEALASGNVRAALLDRFFAVVDEAGLDEDRARAWVLVRGLVNVAWALEDSTRGVAPDPDWLTVMTTMVKAVQP